MSLPNFRFWQLDYPGIKISGIEIISKGRNKNELSTSWEQSDVNLSRGIDFTPRGNVFARFTHLQHQGYTIRLLVGKHFLKRISFTLFNSLLIKFSLSG